MAEGKDTRSFFRKVVNFVVNPATDWGEPGKTDESARDSELAKTELKAMIERKRRNDFVRKRELDMLRRLRRQGLTPDQLAALGSSSGMADTEGRTDTEAPLGPGMMAKIDEIEQQMAGHAIPTASRHPPPPGEPLPRTVPADDLLSPAPADTAAAARGAADALHDADRRPAERGRAAQASPAGAVVTPPPSAPRGGLDVRSTLALEVTEAAQDPALDEVAIAYANGETDAAEATLLSLVRQGAPRNQHTETWLVLFDLYRATGQQAKFEAMAIEFAERFGRSAPHWFSMPKLMADAAARVVPPRPHPARIDGRVGWVCPEHLTPDAVNGLKAKTQTMPLPWVFDWSALKRIDTEAAQVLADLLQHWSAQTIDMRWIGGESLLELLAEAAPIGVADADPVFWQLRLLILRLSGRPDRFDEVAIDYCVTFERSPPSWETTACRVRISGPAGGTPTQVTPPTIIGDASTSFVESQIADEPGLVQMVKVDLSGALAGDISEALGRLSRQIGSAKLVEVSCGLLLRVDFMASGDLLNWVLKHQRDGRRIGFVETNRLVALFFRAVGIDQQATVAVRQV